jgi:[ribosomal protein S5]-alanine N-acetyltransferase
MMGPAEPVYRPGVLPVPAPLRSGPAVVRAWAYDDLPCIEEASRDQAIPPRTTVPSPFSEAAGRAFVERQWGRQASGEGLSVAIAEAATGAAVGLLSLLHRQQPGVVGVGYWIVPSRRRRGLAGAALRGLSRWALGLPGVARLEALVEPGNEGSLRVLDAAGFRREGLLRCYLVFDEARRDAWIYSLIDSDVRPAAG